MCVSRLAMRAAEQAHRHRAGRAARSTDRQPRRPRRAAGLYAIVVLALVEDRVRALIGALLCDVQVRAHRPACPRPVPDATVRRAAQTWGGANGPDLPYALPDDYDQLRPGRGLYDGADVAAARRQAVA